VGHFVPKFRGHKTVTSPWSRPVMSGLQRVNIPIIFEEFQPM